MIAIRPYVDSVWAIHRPQRLESRAANGQGAGNDLLKRDLEMPDADCDMDFWLSEQIIAGDVDYALSGFWH